MMRMAAAPSRSQATRACRPAAAAPAPPLASLSPLPRPAIRGTRHAASTSAAATDPATTTSGAVAAGPAAAVATGSTTLQVTRANFPEALAQVRAALSACQFFAFDCEMTGLTLDGQEDKLLDDVFDRHERTVAAAQQFLVCQLGVSAFVWRPDGSGGGSYEARTFNFYAFPTPRGEFDPRFVCQASSLAFLASQGFDFNKVGGRLFDTLRACIDTRSHSYMHGDQGAGADPCGAGI
jgi:hypothetical protein